MVATAIYSIVERNRIFSVQSHGKALKKECCLLGVIINIIIITVQVFINVVHMFVINTLPVGRS